MVVLCESREGDGEWTEQIEMMRKRKLNHNEQGWQFVMKYLCYSFWLIYSQLNWLYSFLIEIYVVIMNAKYIHKFFYIFNNLKKFNSVLIGN